MARPRLKGFLDPIFRRESQSDKVGDLAKVFGVTRQTINRWQRDPNRISEYHKMRINLLFIGHGLKPPFPVTDKDALKGAIRT